MSSPLDTSTYQISVLRVDDTRGGSAFMHENVSKGMTLEMNKPSISFQSPPGASCLPAVLELRRSWR